MKNKDLYPRTQNPAATRSTVVGDHWVQKISYIPFTSIVNKTVWLKFFCNLLQVFYFNIEIEINSTMI